MEKTKNREKVYGMTQKEKRALQKIESGMDHILHKMKVNGDAGLEDILKAQYRRDLAQDKAISELTSITQSLRAKKNLSKALSFYLDNSPLLKMCKNVLFSRAFWIIVIVTLFALQVITEATGLSILKLIPLF